LTRFEPSKVTDWTVSYVLDAFNTFVVFALVTYRVEAEGGVGITANQVEDPLFLISTLVKGLFPDAKKGWKTVKLVLFAFSDKVSNDETIALLDAQYEAVFLNATSAKLLTSRVVVFVKLSKSSTSVKRFLLEKEEAVHFWYTVFTHFLVARENFDIKKKYFLPCFFIQENSQHLRKKILRCHSILRSYVSKQTGHVAYVKAWESKEDLGCQGKIQTFLKADSKRCRTWASVFKIKIGWRCPVSNSKNFCVSATAKSM
jgi:hypothetical protein